jgi:multiple sugar transport system permease protein
MTRRRIPILGRAILLATIVVASLFPIYWMAATSITSFTSLFVPTPVLVPPLDGLATYVRLFQLLPMTLWLTNSGLISFGTALLGLLIALPAGYALSRYRFRGRATLGFAMFVTQMMPEALLLVPLYAIFLGLGLANQLYGLVVADTCFTMPILVWLIKDAVDLVPLELEEAARIDGCSVWTLQRRVVWPLIAPSIAASAVIAFFYAWNEFLFANTFVLDPSLRPASVGLAALIGEFTTPVDLITGGGLIYTLPAVIFFLLVQRRIVSGLVAGAVTG